MLSDRNIGGHSIVRAEWFSKDRGGLPKSHNGPVSPHLSVPLQRGEWAAHLAVGKQGTLRDSQGPLTDPRVISWVTVPLTPRNMLRFVYVCLPFSLRWADVHAVSSKEKATPLPIHQRVAHSRKRRRPEENLGIGKLWISKGAFSAEIDDDSGIINYAKRRTKRTHTHSRMLVFSRCWVVNESHLFTASTDR